MVRQGAIRRCQRISGIDDSGLAQCDPLRTVATVRLREVCSERHHKVLATGGFRCAANDKVAGPDTS